MLFTHFDESMVSIGGYEPWWSWNTVDIMLIWNLNEFTTVPKGSDLLYHTNESLKVFRVLCGWSVRRTRSYRCEKNKERQEFKLGDAQGTQLNISRIHKHPSLGMPRLASHLSSSTIIGIPQFLFCSHDLCPLCFSFSLRTMLVWDSPSLIYRMLHVLHLYLLSMVL